MRGGLFRAAPPEQIVWRCPVRDQWTERPESKPQAQTCEAHLQGRTQRPRREDVVSAEALAENKNVMPVVLPWGEGARDLWQVEVCRKMITDIDVTFTLAEIQMLSKFSRYGR